MIITRFAPSPTGLLHIGSIKPALLNYFYSKRFEGKFMLRIDDTDLVRSKDEYTNQIMEDLKWLGLDWDIFAKQSTRIARYEEVKKFLLETARLYECFESQEELEIKRKMLLSRGLPPIYDRASLKLTDKEKENLKNQGRKPHYRFLLKDYNINWQDQIRGNTSFDGSKLSDPILIREDGTMTYILTSVVDDIDFSITNIIRGEDHVTNSAIQVQIFEALGAKHPVFAHHALVKYKEGEISKRIGGFDIKSLREEGILPIAIESLIARLGTSMPIEAKHSLEELIKEFDIGKLGRSPANYNKLDLQRLNHKIISTSNFDQIKCHFKILGIENVDEELWMAVRSNINNLLEIKNWVAICRKPIKPVIQDNELLKKAIDLFPVEHLDVKSWNSWTKSIAEETQKKGKNLFMPLRLALTSMDHGPEMSLILPLIGKETALKRLSGEIA